MEQTQETPPKILVEFSLLPEQKKELQQFMTASRRALRSGQKMATDGLESRIRETFPRESLEMLKAILEGKSEFALLIHNCPEYPRLEKRGTSLEGKDSCSYHIGNALYKMHGARHVQDVMVMRRGLSTVKDMPSPVKVTGGYIHRDCLVDERTGQAEYVVFSSPFNHEDAVTEIIPLRRALESIPEAVRKAIPVVVAHPPTDRNYTFLQMNLDQALNALNAPPGSSDFIERIELPKSLDPSGPEARTFTEAIARHGVSINLQPGDLLVVNENSMFHRAHKGDRDKIMALPPEQLSRALLHNAGGRLQ